MSDANDTGASYCPRCCEYTGAAFHRCTRAPITHGYGMGFMPDINQTLTLKEEDIMGDNLFETKDSGERQEFSTGMVRDIQTDKPRYDLIWQPGIKRLAELMTRGAAKYSARNWEKASTFEELERFKASAYRHFMQWFAEETDEDHMAGTIFNLFGAEFVKNKLKADV